MLGPNSFVPGTGKAEGKQMPGEEGKDWDWSVCGKQ